MTCTCFTKIVYLLYTAAILCPSRPVFDIIDNSVAIIYVSFVLIFFFFFFSLFFGGVISFCFCVGSVVFASLEAPPESPLLLQTDIAPSSLR